METRTPTDRPHIILVNADDLGWGDLACFGSRLHDTPHLDRMAAEGTVFTSFYQGSPVCSPSRAAMLTGCYPRRIGCDRFFRGEGREPGWVLFPGDPSGLSPSEVTIARLLRSAGYATRIIGKWHCGDQPEFFPTRHGFDGYFGLPYSNDMGRQVHREFCPPLPLMRDEDVVEEQPDQSSLTERYVEDAVTFLREHRHRPFFLYLAHMYVHLPLYVPEVFARTSRSGAYGAAVACIDWAMGVIRHEICRLGLASSTLILFTSDNGSRCDYGPSNGPLRGRKGTTWEGGMRVPFIACWPGAVPAGRVIDGLASGMDLLPTLCRIAGVPVPDDRIIDGVDISDLLFGTRTCSPRQTMLYYMGDYLDAVRDSRWKLRVGRSEWKGQESGLCELYDLQEDPGETVNVAHRHPDEVRRLMREIERGRRDLGDSHVKAPGDNRRPAGLVSDARTLTVYDADTPYLVPMYDLDQVG